MTHPAVTRGASPRVDPVQRPHLIRWGSAMTDSRHRRVTVAAAAAALTCAALLLTACDSDADGSQQGVGATSTAPTAPTAATAATAPATGSSTPSLPTSGTSPAGEQPAPQPTATSAWSTTKQFMQIQGGRLSDGRLYLSVRPALKKAMTEPFEAWQVVPTKGSYTEVVMTKDGRVLATAPLNDQSVPEAMAQTDFLTRLRQLPAGQRSNVGYDVTFDPDGRVTRVQSLFTS
jgi:hypothetical protein